MIRVLFVCLGNICRSPMAEGLFKKYVEDQKMDHHFRIESRGTSTWEVGNPPHPNTQKILKRLNISIEGMKSEHITKIDLETFDYIIGMDHDNIKYLRNMGKEYHHKIHLFRDINPVSQHEIVEDPYYTGKYEETNQLLSKDIELWFNKMIEDLNINH
jgi:protein-tyrosine phosphatase